ncbi:MAG: YggS family pyridoxal phosphate-dependent enzyme [Elusimicrobiota bacterium]|nr:YggS family pyridoxal phosphate-dependent enzyme [Elusimicrobiota bacterium]
MTENTAVLANYDNVLERIKAASLKSGRDFEKINILAVTKYARSQDIATLLTHRNVFAVGESRVQDSLQKWNNAPLNAFKTKKFFIGQLQSNKTLKVLEKFDIICSLDNAKISARLNEQAEKLDKKANCLLQVKLTEKLTQGGADLDEAPALIKVIKEQNPNINLRGVMAIAPIAPPQELRRLFKKVKNFFDNNFEKSDYLSLGMSEDYEVAVEEGSNLPRIGGAIFKNNAGGNNDN